MLHRKQLTNTHINTCKKYKEKVLKYASFLEAFLRLVLC